MGRPPQYCAVPVDVVYTTKPVGAGLARDSGVSVNEDAGWAGPHSIAECQQTLCTPLNLWEPGLPAIAMGQSMKMPDALAPVRGKPELA